MSDNPELLFPDAVPQRVISLVPSMTESLFELGLGAALVGVSDYCNRPEAAQQLPKVGGPKDARIADIAALAPDLVIANREENTRELVEGLQAAGMAVWLTFPCTVRAALDDLWTLARLFHSNTANLQLDMLERSLEWTLLANQDRPRRRFFCPIWQQVSEADGAAWWMTFNGQTYMSDLLGVFGAENVFAARQRRYPLLADVGDAAEEAPGERDTRYPRVTLAEIVAAQPDLILLPDEPYAYGAADAAAARKWFANTPAAENGQILLVDGSLLTWSGTRLGMALAVLDGLINS
jgi:ABC-type hemin transport system substrate-binding protein